MFHGKAELIDPEKNVPVACFTETCQGDGTAKMKVVLATPISISGTERLAIYSISKTRKSSRLPRTAQRLLKLVSLKAPARLVA